MVGGELRAPFPCFALVFCDRHMLSLGERLIATHQSRRQARRQGDRRSGSGPAYRFGNGMNLVMRPCASRRPAASTTSTVTNANVRPDFSTAARAMTVPSKAAAK